MRDDEIRSRLKEETASIHAPNDVCYRILRRIEGKEEPIVKKKLLLSPVLSIILMTMFVCTALAAAGFLWGHPLDDTLQLGSGGNTAGVVSYPDISVNQEDVTVRLDQCVVDEHTAYIAFVISGYQLPEGKDPGFRNADAIIELESGHGKAGHFLAYSADGNTDTYMDDSGNLVYAFLISSPNESLIGRNVHIEFTDLGIWNDAKPKTVDTVVPGTWTFDWTLTGVVHTATYANLSLPIGDTGWILTSASITPVTAIVTMDGPKNIQDTGNSDAQHAEPFFLGVVHNDGQEERLAGMLGGTDHSVEHKQYVTLNRVIDVGSLKSLIFAVPDAMEPIYVDLPEQAVFQIQ